MTVRGSLTHLSPFEQVVPLRAPLGPVDACPWGQRGPPVSLWDGAGRGEGALSLKGFSLRSGAGAPRGQNTRERLETRAFDSSKCAFLKIFLFMGDELSSHHFGFILSYECVWGACGRINDASPWGVLPLTEKAHARSERSNSVAGSCPGSAGLGCWSGGVCVWPRGLCVRQSGPPCAHRLLLSPLPGADTPPAPSCASPNTVHAPRSVLCEDRHTFALLVKC